MAFAAAGGPLLAQGHGQAEWDACVASVLSPPSGSNTTRLPLLEAELNAQQGSGDEPDVSALPTMRVNGRQYRGTLEATSVVRALCSAFPRGQEPAVCNEASVSEDECLPGGPGYAQCRVGDAATAGHTRCVNTFESYRCECGQGWVKSVKADTGEEVCEDLNECLVTNVASSDPACSCPRCACVNLPGSFRCTGALPNKCNASYDYGGCWRTTVEGRVVHACRDTLQDYQRLAARGRLQDTDDWFTCQCPGCFQPVSGVPTTLVCEPQCPWAQCQEQGRGGGGPVCQQPEAGPGPAGAGSPGQGGGMSGGAVVTVALLSMGCTLVALAALYQYVLRDRMQAEVRDAMQQYMPLSQASRCPPPPPPSGPGLPGYDPDEEAAPLLSTLPLTAGPFPSSSPAGSARPGLPPPRPVPLAPGSAAGEAGGGSGPDKAFRRTAFGSLITITADSSSSSSSLAGRGEAALGLLPSRLRAGSGEGGSEELGGGGYQAPPLTLSPSEGGLEGGQEGGQGATPAGRGAGVGGPLGVGLPGPL
ncbi:hypothetical protein QJQ45_000514 [Haematococcus lacustris]|nr:hypothetical protein QJQ45_000514 [Haematococcus lacustris]